jgi:hypothetical protein
MFDTITVDDLFAVYEQLKDKYELTMTTSLAVDDGFEGDWPLLLAKAHGLVLWLYEWGGDFVLDVMDEKHTKGTHWHPVDVESAVKHVTEFMEGKSDYELQRYPKSRLTIVRSENKMTIKKKAGITYRIVFAGLLLAGILLPICINWSKNAEIFWVGYAVGAYATIVWFASVFYSKIVIDSNKKEISIYDFCKETYRFNEVKEVKGFYKEGDPDGGRDISKVVFLLADGRRSEFETGSQAQTEELIAVLNKILFS